MTLIEAYWPLALTIIFIGALRNYLRIKQHKPLEELKAAERHNRFFLNERYRIGSWSKAPRRKDLQAVYRDDLGSWEIF